jgi:subtilisin family serine protease
VVGVRKAVLLLTLIAAAAFSWASSTTLAQESTTLVPEQTTTPELTPARDVIPGQYIIVLKEDIRDPTAVAREHARGYGAQVLHTYQHALNGYAARIADQRLDEVLAEERVGYVEPDQRAYATAQTLPWGINRVDADLSSTKAGNGSGAVSKVNVYIIDTGIYQHADLNVIEHVNFARDGKNRDCYGHGTHLAGIAAARDNDRAVVGVAPGASLIGVKVLDCDGAGSLSSVLKGVDWVTANAKKPAIANMSLAGPASRILDDTVRKSARSGVFYSLAAGDNSASNACKFSPARAGAGTNNGIATVAATNKRNAEPSWSDYGKCVDIWAPGVSILSTKMGNGTTTMSGVSQASPHVGGGAALYLSSHKSASPSRVETALKRAAKKPGTKSKNGRAILLEYVGRF